LEEFQQKNQKLEGRKLQFAGVGDRDVYNITAPFLDQEELVIAGRVEARDTEESAVYFFVEKDGIWSPCPSAPVFRLQDPFVTRIGDEIIFGGVETFPHPSVPGALGWRTNLYRGTTLSALKKFASGPDGMKDLRLIELDSGKIGVFTRPQGEVGGRGTIGFTVVDTLEHLTLSAIRDASLLEQFMPEEWGGANEIHRLENGLLGVLGHVACFDAEGARHYYPMVFCLNPDNLETSPMRLIATRANFPDGPSKRADLQDVVFSGGLRRLMDGRGVLYAGIADAEAHYLDMADPFLTDL
jgi:hypothetical protein